MLWPLTDVDAEVLMRSFWALLAIAGVGCAGETKSTPVQQATDVLDAQSQTDVASDAGSQPEDSALGPADSEATVDIDLNVSGPDGKIASGEQATEAGLLKDRDCPGITKSCYGQNIENVFLAEGRPLAGRYRVVVRLEDLRGVEPPIKVHLSSRIGQRHFSSSLALTKSNQQHAFEFSL